MEKKTFKDFPYVSLRESGDLRGKANFDPRGITWINLVELDATYQIPKL